MRWGVLGLVLTLLAGCASVPAPPDSGPGTTEVQARDLPRLPADGRFDDQIGGAYAPRADVVVVDRDRQDDPVPGRFNVCYVNAFQTQPDETGLWAGERRDLLVQRDGRLLTDPGWPGEHLLDTSTAAKRGQRRVRHAPRGAGPR